MVAVLVEYLLVVDRAVCHETILPYVGDMADWLSGLDGRLVHMEEMFVTVDSRGRTTLGKGHAGQYRLTEVDGGVLVLEPGSFVTTAQQQVWRNPELQQHLQEAVARPGGPRPTRT